ncbi:MAG: hypothetical protein AAGI89_08600 [Pseudomonadota bacterium]
MKKTAIWLGSFALTICLLISITHAQEEEECDLQCESQREAQDPTASINGVFFSNTIGFGPESDNTLYNFQVQPIATVAQEEWGNVLLRGIVPVLGVPTPVPGDEGNLDTEFGLGDTTVQAIFIPSNQEGFTFGFGPQISLPTHTDTATKSSEWGAGLVGAGFGFAGPLSYGVLVTQMWGDEDLFNETTLQPIAYYNLETPVLGPWFFGYNAIITHDWNAGQEDNWTVPIGLTVGKTIILPSKDAATINIGAYDLVESGQTDNEWQLRFSFNLLFN